MVTGLIFGVPGLAAVLAGPVGGRHGYRTVLPAGLAVQGLAIVPLVFIGETRLGVVVLIPALLVSFLGHATAIVAFSVTATSGLPNEEQGLATGLTTMTQNVAITIGILVLGAVGTTQGSELAGIHLASTVNVVVVLVSAALVTRGLRSRTRQEAVPVLT